MSTYKNDKVRYTIVLPPNEVEFYFESHYWVLLRTTNPTKLIGIIFDNHGSRNWIYKFMLVLRFKGSRELIN